MHATLDGPPRVAVLLPCYNEALTIGKVVEDFRAALPHAHIYVYDNNSTDGTAQVAADAGATVVPSRRQGKGFVVQHMFATIDADLYIMADGDDTYPASEAPRLLAVREEHDADMVVGVRLRDHASGAFRPFHMMGNLLVAGLITWLFGSRVTDVLSGYRVFSRRFVRTAPLSEGGFGTETEMTLQALSKGFSLTEAPVRYGARPEGSHSKLNTYRDGYVVLKALFLLFKDYKPLVFFTAGAAALAVACLAAGTLPVWDYISTGFVSHVPLAVLAATLGLLSAMSFFVGLLLDTLSTYHRERFLLTSRILERLP